MEIIVSMVERVLSKAGIILRKAGMVWRMVEIAIWKHEGLNREIRGCLGRRNQRVPAEICGMILIVLFTEKGPASGNEISYKLIVFNSAQGILRNSCASYGQAVWMDIF